jgi:hypothetical protein
MRAIVSSAIFAACLAPLSCSNIGTLDIEQCDYSAPCHDIEPPTRLDIVNTPTIAECDDMGGAYVGTTCVGVDY